MHTARQQLFQSVNKQRAWRNSATSAWRSVHVRALSYTALPRFVVRAFRVPIAGVGVGAGAFGYANYKVEELREQTTGLINDIQDSAADFYDATSKKLSPYFASAGTSLSSFGNSARGGVESAKEAAESESAREAIAEKVGELEVEGWAASVGKRIKSLGSGGSGKEGRGAAGGEGVNDTSGGAGCDDAPEPAVVMAGAASSSVPTVQGTKPRSDPDPDHDPDHDSDESNR